MYLLIKKCVKDFYKENVHKGNNQKEILLINQGQFETQLFFIKENKDEFIHSSETEGQTNIKRKPKLSCVTS